ncbi:hypothetical protein N0V90_013220 [Kalmusia sp. IMI 367209]|nr:hypothetical protein N0V90_013220 [Kalmusia sp. IMI 367209]
MLNSAKSSYLPSVKDKLRCDWEEEDARKGSPELDKLRDHLTKEFHIPLWFWEKQGWDANGFFKSEENPIMDLGGDGSSHFTISRFLLKEVGDQKAPDSLKYHWRFLAFSTLWVRKKANEDATLILLCFDLIEEEAPLGRSMHTIFQEYLRKLAGNEVLQCPYRVYIPLIEVIVSQYNRAGWTFRGPVRTVEKTPQASVIT